MNIHVDTDVQYRVEPREIKARLDSPTVVSVMELGYSRDLVRRAIERRLTTMGLFSLFQFVHICLTHCIAKETKLLFILHDW